MGSPQTSSCLTYKVDSCFVSQVHHLALNLFLAILKKSKNTRAIEKYSTVKKKRKIPNDSYTIKIDCLV